MADPRSFVIKPCRETAAGQAGDRRAFFGSIGKVGDLEILNDIGGTASKVGQGLRTLAKISNTIRTGCGALPSSIANAIDTGANWVLDSIGIAPTVVDALRGLNPSIANQAYSQAKQVFTMVKQGSFRPTDIPSVLQDFQNLERLGRNIFTPGAGPKEKFEVCGDVSPYAMDLISRAPKYKFMFVVEFIFNDQYTGLKNLDFAFVVKTSSRPNIKIQTEDVNYYNFRSKVITKTEFEEMRMTFHDDNGFGIGAGAQAAGDARKSGEIGNYAVRFYNAYMRATAPITNASEAGQFTVADQLGMAFDLEMTQIEAGIEAQQHTASRGVLAGDVTNIIREVRLFHVYNYGHAMNVYNFFNPRITNLTLDDLDMSSSDGTELSMSFNYDSVYIDTGVPLTDEFYNISDLTKTGRYPLRYNAANGKPIESNTTPTGGATSAGSGVCGTQINTSTPPFFG